MRKSDVINYFGGVSKPPKPGIKHPSVSEWPEIIPEGRAYQLEKITNGKLKVDVSLYQNTNSAAA
ncbi:Cro/CI family transcriptional regulator [Escherichia coli]